MPIKAPVDISCLLYRFNWSNYPVL